MFRNAVNLAAFSLSFMAMVLIGSAIAYAPPPWLSVLTALPQIAAGALP
jgi:hypothetical protein